MELALELINTGKVTDTQAAYRIGLTNLSVANNPSALVVVASQDGGQVRTFSGSLFQPDCSIADIEHTDLILVSGIWRDVDQFLMQHRPSMEWLVEQYKQGAMIACMHTGAFLLTETGLLDNKVATIYWRMVEQFKSRYPKVILQPKKKHHLRGQPVLCYRSKLGI